MRLLVQILGGSNFSRGNRVFSSPKCPDGLWCSTNLLLNGHWCCFLEVKRPGREVKK
jgi:hypothetical protein